ncbi:MAG: hypothetical protein AAFX40_16945 [Cyanobacteria bacterium J06639_1]
MRELVGGMRRICSAGTVRVGLVLASWGAIALSGCVQFAEPTASETAASEATTSEPAALEATTSEIEGDRVSASNAIGQRRRVDPQR